MCAPVPVGARPPGGVPEVSWLVLGCLWDGAGSRAATLACAQAASWWRGQALRLRPSGLWWIQPDRVRTVCLLKLAGIPRKDPGPGTCPHSERPHPPGALLTAPLTSASRLSLGRSSLPFPPSPSSNCSTRRSMTSTLQMERCLRCTGEGTPGVTHCSVGQPLLSASPAHVPEAQSRLVVAQGFGCRRLAPASQTPW